MKRPKRDLPIVPYTAEEMGEVPLCESEYQTLWEDGFWPFILRHDCLRREGEYKEWILLSPTSLYFALARDQGKPGRPNRKADVQRLWHLAGRGYKARWTQSMTFIALRKPDHITDIRSCQVARRIDHERLA